MAPGGVLPCRRHRAPRPLDPPRARRETTGTTRSTTAWPDDHGADQRAPPPTRAGITGQGVIIGMLDTGFRTTHEALIGLPVLAAYDFVNDDGNVDNEVGDPSNAKNHGTMPT